VMRHCYSIKDARVITSTDALPFRQDAEQGDRISRAQVVVQPNARVRGGSLFISVHLRITDLQSSNPRPATCGFLLAHDLSIFPI
jgi:hypothetical protein